MNTCLIVVKLRLCSRFPTNLVHTGYCCCCYFHCWCYFHMGNKSMKLPNQLFCWHYSPNNSHFNMSRHLIIIPLLSSVTSRKGPASPESSSTFHGHFFHPPPTHCYCYRRLLGYLRKETFKEMKIILLIFKCDTTF